MLARRALYAVAAVAVAVATPSFAAESGEGSDEGGSRTQAMTATYDEGAGHYDGATCRRVGEPTPYVAPDTCREYYAGDAHFKGSFEGVQHFYLETWFKADGHLGYEGTPTFEATVPGCGKGTFQIHEYDGDIDEPGADPLTGDAQGFNRWTVLPATATGDLAGRLIGGHGVNHWTQHSTRGLDFSATDGFGNGTFSGTLTCRH
ncbi:MAG: hypothetical protein QOJ79_1126 [Actinomycetota bacterium]|jgi:hypothetical protein|nr:hypothetical protein [Actinomycetota bacterium]